MEADGASVFQDYLATYGESDSGAVRFGGEEGSEDGIKSFPRHSDAIVCHREIRS